MLLLWLVASRSNRYFEARRCRTEALHPRTADGRSHVSYNADEASLFGAVSHWPAATHADGAMREVYSWDLGVKLGEIPEPPATYNVMGNANEMGVVIGETTHGGLEARALERGDARS